MNLVPTPDCSIVVMTDYYAKITKSEREIKPVGCSFVHAARSYGKYP